MTELETDVLVVGAGPTGLALSVTLAMRGIRTVTVDKQQSGDNTSRAAVVHARTLEALDTIGAAQPLIAKGVQLVRFTLRDRDRVLMPLDFRRLPSKFNYILMVSQATTEAVLLSRFRELGGEVIRPRSLRDAKQDANGVLAVLDDGTRVHCKYMVGADGMHSTVRELAAIPFAGDSYAASFVLADVTMDGGDSHDEVTLYYAPAGFLVVAPLPGNTYRIVAPTQHADPHQTVDSVQKLLDERGPVRHRAVVRAVNWSSRFHIHHRVAARYRSGRLIIAGDAAHVHSPAGGQGMNTGIQDAIALGDALAQSVRTSSTAPLERYEQTRRPVALRVVAVADRMTRLATLGPLLRPLRNLVFWLVARSKAARQRFALQLAGLSARA